MNAVTGAAQIGLDRPGIPQDSRPSEALARQRARAVIVWNAPQG
ncbi:hypothetical protein BBIA_1257 [Bifidobacterium biavatii DSM 23969]|uniref:Uncharacterized protein n=1 Tax=Bifidobacterium biavatii DSM 23969 TaxID=1437608 RepID=A0A087A559_9BIFI|nr:hypothetical protein BBIA_1257 [Bifidobacterium biavatii DSM 23969]